ncbi:hypothetical protein MEME101129_28710 [Methylobacterium mesophilicum]
MGGIGACWVCLGAPADGDGFAGAVGLAVSPGAA